VYNGIFVPATPCLNVRRVVPSTSGGGPHIYFAEVFTTGTYQIVISSTDQSTGVFSIHVDPADFYANSGLSTNWAWQADAGGNGEVPPACESDSGEVTQYVSYVFTVPSVGLYDINVIFANYTAFDFDFSATLYQIGNVAFLGTGNASVGVDPCGCSNCAANWVNTIEEDDISRVSDQAGGGGVFASLTLLPTVNYTVVMQTQDSTNYGPFGVVVRPTIYGNLGQNTNYNSPDLSTYTGEGTCMARGSLANWRAVVFTAQYPTYVVDTGPTDVGFDSESDLYIGNNGGSADQTTPPSTCTGFLQCVDAGDVGPLSFNGFIVGQNYTIVVTTYSTGNAANGTFTLFMFTGQQIGPVSQVTTGVASGVVTTGVASTTGFSSATTAAPRVTTGTPAATTGTPAVTTAAPVATTAAVTSVASFILPSFIFALIAVWFSL